MSNSHLTHNSRISNAKNFMKMFRADDENSIYAVLGKSSSWKQKFQINAMSQTNPIVITSYGHKLKNNDTVTINDVTGMTELNNWSGSPLVVANAEANSFELVGIDSRNFSTYIGGGYVQNEDIRDIPDLKRTDYELSKFWYSALAMKRLNYSNVSLVAPRINWTSGEVYNQYDYQKESNSNFYVINSNNCVYKCLWNSRNSPSVIEPESKSLLSFTLSDGYVWKYMFQIQESDINTFMNDDWFPVKTLENDNGTDQWQMQYYSIGGTLDHVQVVNFGEGYDLSSLTVEVEGDGIDAVVEVQSEGLSTDNGIVDIKVINPGKGYSWANIIIKDPNGGYGAYARALLSPIKGHGYDPVSELQAHHVMIVSSFAGTENNKIFVDNSFRQYGIVYNPKEGENIASKEIYDLRYTVTIEDLQGEINQNETLVGNTSKFKCSVVNVDDNTLYVTEMDGVYLPDEVISSSGTGLATIVNLEKPKVNIGSGNLVYIENINHIVRSETQQEKLRTIVNF